MALLRNERVITEPTFIRNRCYNLFMDYLLTIKTIINNLVGISKPRIFPEIDETEKIRKWKFSRGESGVIRGK